MGFFARLKAIWNAILNRSVSDLEDKHAVALAESKLKEATERLKEGRQGLISYQAMVLKVEQQVADHTARAARLTGEIKAHLREGREEIAAELALELSQVRGDLTNNEEQLRLHREAYENNLLKMKAALTDIENAKGALEKKKAALQMEKALAEVAEAAGALDSKWEVSTDLSEVLGRVDHQINKSKARTKVASDLSGQDIDRLKAKEEVEKSMARELLEQFKIEEGLVDRASAPEAEKTVGPAEETQTKRQKAEETE
jgi:phage shock protein A